MLKIIGCLTQQHNYWLVALAAVICLAGSALTMRLFARMRQAPADQRGMHVLLAGVIGGATIWTTHFVAMVAYDPVLDHAYEPVLTALSLFVGMIGVTAAFAVATATRCKRSIGMGGAVLGLTVACMHYTGMSALLLPGRIVWDPVLVISSVVLGAGFGALAFDRIARPHLRRSWLAGVGAMTLAICLMHFTGMGAISIELDGSISVPAMMLSDETLIVLVVSVMSMFLLVGLAAFMIESKITARAGADFEHATMHDALTGLPNRVHLHHYLGQLTTTIASSEATRIAIVTLDLNRFKEINDMHGHLAGDELLKTIAARMNDALVPGEFVARTGGDEFVAVKRRYDRLSEVKAFAERLIGRIIEPVRVGQAELAVGVSVGIAAYPEHGSDIETLLNHSDLAMYRAKEGQLETVCVFDVDMDQQNRDRIELTSDLRQALLREEFELYFQAQNDVQTRKTVGFEALLRWNHPVRGRVSPAEFIPIAEKTGLIRPIGVWVLRAACAEAAKWKNPYRIAVNVAPQQLVQPSFVEHVADALMESGLAPERLELEITEASIIDDHKNTLDVMSRLKAMGVRIAMDDFGTGYSSLASLRAFPFDKIKIDRSFVSDVHVNEQSAAIVRSTLILGGALGIPVLAEGVETQEELAFLGAEHCSEVQGYFFGKPMSIEQLQTMLAGGDGDAEESDAA